HTANTTTYQLDFPYKSREDIIRGDYRINNEQRLYLRYIHDMYDLIEPRGTFITADLPTTSTHRRRPAYSYQLGHSWVLRSNLINDAKFNTSWNSQRIPPAGDAWRRDTYGFQFPQVDDNGRYDEGIPDVSITNYPTLTGPSQSLLSPTTDITMTDTLPWLKNRHSMRFGAIVTRNRKDQNGRLAHTGVANFSTAGNTKTTGDPRVDALLGNFRTYSEGGDDPLGFFRFTQAGGFVSDTWQARNHLRREPGLPLTRTRPISPPPNNRAIFDPALHDPADAALLNPNGSIASPGINRYTGMIRAGDGIPSDQLDRVTIDPVAAQMIPTGADRGLYETHQLFMPRFSAAYSLNEKTVFRGGVGAFQDQPADNVIFS